jgi:hypothetical protein
VPCEGARFFYWLFEMTGSYRVLLLLRQNCDSYCDEIYYNAFTQQSEDIDIIIFESFLDDKNGTFRVLKRLKRATERQVEDAFFASST